MPTLRELLTALPINPDDLRRVELEIRQRWPGERAYIPPATSRKDPDRRQAIAEAVRRLPVSTVALRFGVSRQYVYKIVKLKR